MDLEGTAQQRFDLCPAEEPALVGVVLDEESLQVGPHG
jgi:hypothetical protein